MSQLTNLWILVPLLGLLVVIAAVAFTIGRGRRSRAPDPPARSPEPSPIEADADFLDSSHIGLEPFVGTNNLAHYGGGISGKDSENGRR